MSGLLQYSYTCDADKRVFMHTKEKGVGKLLVTC